MRDKKGRFIKGVSYSPSTQFKKGEHWRKEKPFWNKDWLIEEYCVKEKSAKEIGDMFGVHENAIYYWCDKHNINRRSVGEARQVKHWGCSGVDNPMWNRRGELNPRWRGGITPERQEFYTSQKWKDACKKVWKRDNGICQRCGLKKTGDMPFHIHHIVSFSDNDLRADVGNLILLCEACHWWVHSRRNVDNEYIQEK